MTSVACRAVSSRREGLTRFINSIGGISKNGEVAMEDCSDGLTQCRDNVDDMDEPIESERQIEAAPKSSPDDLKTLKHRLAGPSINKAGQDTVDQKKVSEIIYEVSKGSKFFNNEQAKDRQLTEKIDRTLSRKRQLEKFDLTQDLRRADEYISSLELSRDLSQTIVHIDCDAFYAAVEELDRPELKNVPFAVGKGVLTTCNYEARKFGCRSGMAGFVAKALCPQLINLPLNFDKYNAKATEVRAVLADYDPRFESASIDEAYLNITSYCEEKEMDPDGVVQQLRREVFEKCKITVSAGIASNAKLAKIASNKNKPNGQFRILAGTYIGEQPNALISCSRTRRQYEAGDFESMIAKAMLIVPEFLP